MSAYGGIHVNGGLYGHTPYKRGRGEKCPRVGESHVNGGLYGDAHIQTLTWGRKAQLLPRHRHRHGCSCRAVGPLNCPRLRWVAGDEEAWCRRRPALGLR